jgi:hypothetical protein
LEETEATKDAAIKVVSNNQPEGAIDIEFMKIASEDLPASNDLDAVKAVPRISTDGDDQTMEAKV